MKIPGEIGDDYVAANLPTGDGFLYWLQSESLLSFDLNKEKFRLINLPDDLIRLTNGRLGRWNLAESMGCLVLWLPPQKLDHTHPEKFTLFVLEDDQGKKWNKRCIQLPQQLVGDSANLIVVVGKLPTVWEIRSAMSPGLLGDHRTNKFDRFLIGKLPPCPGGGPSLLGDFYSNPYIDADDGANIKGRFHRSCHDSILCLLDNNNLYLSLDDVLSGGV
ncbi:OLC1v1022465C1 [Oldenlandia corymbosa var. corymbosa]|uniref:OLC1v1022465C1 n=1 Tax=Oldenlandia corymbosa var. corymbosa TaxID=529605 RepID=A0AAV1C098_OLDCO|nr:OLC1v1022465C1 [Oldenlandia corymbosa var. corymbosa]